VVRGRGWKHEAVLGRVLGGRYRVDQMLGRGGMATVWQGRDLRLDRPVAIKVVSGPDLADPTAVDRFDREARTVARLAHPNIVGVYDFASDGSDSYLVMELLEGHTVSAMLAGGPLPVADAVAISMQVCDGLTAAQAAGVIHRDIKPGNLIVTPAGVVKICDFGVARLIHAAQVTLTGPATAIGTSEYMAPEQASGEPVDARADLYALGCTMYAMLTGAVPFAGADPLSVLHQHVNRSPAPLRTRRADVPPALDELVRHLLAKNPADRPPDAGQVKARLAALSRDPALVASSATVSLPSAAPLGATPVEPVTSGGAAGPPAADPAPASPGDRNVPAQARHPETAISAPAAAGTSGAGDGFRRRRRSVALATTAIVVVLLALIAAFLLGRTGSRQSSQEPPATQPAAPPAAVTTTPAAPTTAAAPSTASPSATAASPTPRAVTTTPAVPSNPIVATRLAIQTQVQTGQISPDAARDLYKKVDEIARAIDEGNADEAAKKVKELQDKLADLRADSKLTAAGHDALVGVVDQIEATLPPRQ
jgi:eukaryotic-like serine/threonine-protein kinase